MGYRPDGKVRCVFCGEWIVPDHPNHPEEVGFASLRKAGGTNALALRKRTGHWACQSCIDIRTRGPKKQRESLF